jgi:hypothetical protein
MNIGAEYPDTDNLDSEVAIPDVFREIDKLRAFFRFGGMLGMYDEASGRPAIGVVWNVWRIARR